MPHDLGERSSLGARRAALRLLAPPLRPPRPPYEPARRLPRRPGERREPLALSRRPGGLAAVAGARGLDLGCAVELCLERALVLRDLEEQGLAPLYPSVLRLAGTVQVHAALPTSKARYLQVLLAARERSGRLQGHYGESEAIVDVPLRLFPRVIDVADSAGFHEDDLDEALRLEVAAVSAGRLMSEWAALATVSLIR